MLDITVKLKQISLFPILINNKSSILYKKIYTKHLLLFFCLLELKQKNNFNLLYRSNFLSLRKKTKATQILRSPNRHKIAQFHIIKNYYLINSKFSLKIKINNINYNILLIYNFLILNFLNFESSLLFIKNVQLISKINLKMCLI